MQTQFVNTENVKRLSRGVAAVQKRGAGEACLMVVDGIPGLGKTTTLRRWVAQNSCVYLRAKKMWSASWFLKELLADFRVEPPHTFEKKYGLALQQLGQRQNRATIAGRDFALVIDEVDHVASRAEIMETIRDLSDMLEVPVILVGMGSIRDKLTRFPQITSRVSQYVRFEQASEADVRAMVDGLCEVKIADDLMKFVHFVSEGMNREILEAIKKMETFGRRLDLQGQPMGLAHMAGQMIMNDRKTGEPITVPETL